MKSVVGRIIAITTVIIICTSLIIAIPGSIQVNAIGWGDFLVELNTGVTSYLSSVAMNSEGYVWTSSACGEVLIDLPLDPDGPKQLDTGTTNYLNSIEELPGLEQQGILDVQDTVLWAVGIQGTIIYTADGGTTWTPQTSGTDKILLGVSAIDTSHAWAVGEEGTILFYNGAAWTAQNSGTTNTLSSVAAVDASHVWAVSDEGTILFFNGTSWSAQTSGTDKKLNGVSAVDSNNLWVVGDEGTILNTSDGGATWSAQSSGITCNLSSVKAVNTSHVWAVGEEGTLLLYNGSAWTQQDIGYTKYFSDVEATGVTDLCISGEQGLLLYANTGAQPTTPTAWYFAEGSCRPGYDCYLCIQNPGTTDTAVKITYMKGDGTTTEQNLTVSANSRTTVVVKDTLGEADDAAHDFSAKVESTDGQMIIVERPTYFVRSLELAGGHDAMGSTNPAGTYYFAEGTCRPFFDSYLCIQNPNSTDATVRITYMKGDGTTTEQNLTVIANSRSTVTVKDTLGEADDAAHDFSAKVECTNGQTIIVERPTYFLYMGTIEWSAPGGHDVMGATAPASTFYFAEGTCRPGYEPYLCIQNPESTDASVEITYMKGDGTTADQTLTVSANSRSTVKVKDTLGEGDDVAHDFSSKVESTDGVKIIAERPQYFNFVNDQIGNIAGGHNVMGATAPASTFYFAEGTCRPGYESFICIQNPGSTDASVKITYMKGDRTTTEQNLTVSANSRSTVRVKDTLGQADDAAHDFSAKVECINDQLIIAERPTYFDYQGPWAGGWTGGHNVMGYR